MELKDIVRQERLKRKWRQEDLGALIGRSQSHISDIEKGDMPKFDVACMLCEIFGIEPNKLWAEIRNESMGIDKIPIEGGGAVKQAEG